MKKIVVVVSLVCLLLSGCATARNIPEIPVDPISGSKKGLVVTLFRSNGGGYTISTERMEISSEKKNAIETLTGTEYVGTFLMVYDTETESFFLLPTK